jgi:hypothetical protein
LNPFSFLHKKGDALAAFHYTIGGFFHFPIGIVVFAASLAMGLVSVGFPPMVLEHLERFPIPIADTTIFTFQGRLLVDAVIGFALIFFLKRYILAILTLGLMGAVALWKEKELELFHTVFRAPGDTGTTTPNYGVPDDSLGGYQSVDM